MSSKATNPSLSTPGIGLAIDVRKRLNSGFELQVNCVLPPGFSILFGPSGAGKTTLLDCVAGLLVPDAGRIAGNDRTFFDSGQGINLPVHRRAVGYVFQDLALFPHLTVGANVEYGLSRVGTAERRARSERLLASFRIAHLRDRRPPEISGGERQRVALARVLVTDPAVLLLDEPLAGLDASTRSLLLADLRSWNDSHAIPVLYVTHSREEVFALGERVLFLENGKVLAQGSPYEVMQAPRHEAIAEASGVENIFPARVTTLHEAQGTMTCHVAGQGDTAGIELEVPLVAMQPRMPVRVGVRAGDILLAITPPQGLSARNVLRGRILSLEQRDVTVIAQVDCGVVFEVHLTPAARESLALSVGREVWLVIKTYSCHLLR